MQVSRSFLRLFTVVCYASYIKICDPQCGPFSWLVGSIVRAFQSVCGSCRKPTIIAGITQCIMLSLSMVVIAALVGAGGLGVPVVRALNTVQVGMGFEAGFVIVLLAIILDRISRPAEKSNAQ